MQAAKSFFEFPDINSEWGFSFEKLTTENFPHLYLLFENDDSLFTDYRFKHYDTALKYSEDLLKYGKTSPKHGSQDWLFTWNGEYAGILHLYDMSLETFGENNKRCWIGFATKPSIREKGITKKALLIFLTYIEKIYPEISYIHSMTLKGNLPAENLLLSTGFGKDETERHSKKHNFFLIKKIV